MTWKEIALELDPETSHLLGMLAEARGLDPKAPDTFVGLLEELRARIEKADAA
jgi:hypothetical protein